MFSPNDQLVVTGTSLERGETIGQLHFFHRQTFDKVAQLPIAEGVSTAEWAATQQTVWASEGSESCNLF